MLIFLKLLLFTRRKDGKREGGIVCFGMSSSCPQQLGLGHSEARSQEIHLGLSCCARTQNWSHCLLPPKCISRKLVQKWRFWDSNLHSYKVCRHPKQTTAETWMTFFIYLFERHSQRDEEKDTERERNPCICIFIPKRASMARPRPVCSQQPGDYFGGSRAVRTQTRAHGGY